MMPDSARATQDAGAVPRGSVSQQAALAPNVVGELTGLSHAAAWTSVLASEEARWTRYQRPCQVVQMEVAGIAAVAARLGEAPAETLVALLAAVLHEETRRSDLYGRASRWRIQGVLPEQEPGGGPRYAERVRDAFGRRLGPDLHLGLVIGMAVPTATSGFSEVVRAADRAMQQVGQLDRGAAPAVLVPPPDHRGSSAVRDGLVELGLLLRDGLISDEEHRMKRAEILGRL